MSVLSIGILIPALLIVLGLLAGIITLLIKGGSAVRWFLGIFSLLIVIGFFGLFSMRISHRVPVYETSHQQTRPAPAPRQLIEPVELDNEVGMSQGASVHVIHKDSVVWREGLEEELVPDVYSSLETAAYGLGVQLQETISALPQPLKHVTLPRIIIVENNDNVDIALLEQFRRGLKFILPETDIVITSEVTEGQVCVSLQLKDVESREIITSEMQSGNAVRLSQVLHTGSRGILQAVLQIPDNKFSKHVEFDRCQWLYDTDKFQSSASGHQWAVIASKETAVTKKQALEQVAEAAQYYLMSQNGLQNIQKSDLRSHGIIADEYTQRLQGMSGPIWRAALLLDVSPERLRVLQRNRAIVNEHMRRTWIYHTFSLVGMIVLISILYVFVNSITKGYYTTKILFVSVLAFLLFVFILFFH